jgi:hypothetical protein
VTADPAGVLARRFPGLWIWRGAHTGSWWALVPPPAGWRLVEAIDPEELTRAIIHASSWPWPSGTGGASWRRDFSVGTAVVFVTSELVDR